MSSTDPYISVILVAGGLGIRMGTPVPKQFLLLKDKPVSLHSFELFADSKEVFEIIVVCNKSYRHFFPSSARFAEPGERRQDSVYNALQMVSSRAKLVCIHDSARPFLSRQDLEKIFPEALQHKAAALAVPVKYTIKEADAGGFVSQTLERSKLWEMQTPQIAIPDLLHRGFEIAEKNQLTVTDDAALVELTGHPVKLVMGSYRNIKLTTPEDWAFAERLVRDE